MTGISLDTLTYGAVENVNLAEAYERAMQTRFGQHPKLLTLIEPQEIVLHRIIGEGTFGRVWSGKWGASSVAAKEFVFAQAAVGMQREEIIDEIVGEAGMMALLRHPNVLQLFGCSLTSQAIWIVSELCSHGSLRMFLDSERQLPVKLRIRLALQVAEGMTYLHHQEPPIIHRNLTSHNILVHEVHEWEGRRPQPAVVAKVGDWGSARETLSESQRVTRAVEKVSWLAPEVIKYTRHSKKSDVYSFGIILWELATREEVYRGMGTTSIVAMVANESLRPPVPHDCPWNYLMTKCWAEDPTDRVEFEDIVTELDRILGVIN